MTMPDGATPLRILHLEDEAHDQELVRATLESEGLACRIQAVATREAFLAALERGEFDLILSDFALPSFDGLSALKLSREKTPHVPLIFLSGTLGEEAAIEAVRSGATDYVLKQRLSRLVPAVRRAMSEAQAQHKRQQAEDSLRREREFSAQLIASSVDGIMAFGPTFTIAAWNDGMERMTGVPRTTALGRSAVEYFPFLVEFGATVLAPEPALIRPPVARDVPFDIPKTGRKGFFDGHFSPLRDEAGTVAGWLAILHDTTTRRGLEEQMRQAQKMEAVGRLAGGVAHDFNNLLVAILGYGELLRRRLSGQMECLEDLREIETAAQRAASLTRQLLALSRQQVMNPRVLDLNVVIVEMDKMLRRLIGEDIDLKTIPTTSLGRVKADAGQVEQIVMNLVVNARDAMPEGGKLTLETANVTLDAESVGSEAGYPSGTYVMLAVTDTGTGMDAETRSRIFEPFYTTKPIGYGTGLGLSTVHGIVTQSGGHVEVYSEPGHGTTFKVYFPTVDEALEAPQQKRPKKAPLGGKESILIVEDDDLVRNVTTRALEASGYHIVAAATRAEAWDACDARWQEGGTFDLVIADVVMPGMTLTKFVDRVRAVHPTARLLYMSGYTDRAILHQGQLTPREAFLQKPFAIDELLGRIRAMLDEPPAVAA
jgi:two-component system cell cycle sensor histidine kinase/response regulator CckA